MLPDGRRRPAVRAAEQRRLSVFEDEQLNNATGIFNMLRNEGSSLGIAIVTVMVDRRTQLHQTRLAEHIHSSNPMVAPTLQMYTDRVVSYLGTAPAAAMRQSYAMLYQNLQGQPASWRIWMFSGSTGSWPSAPCRSSSS